MEKPLDNFCPNCEEKKVWEMQGGEMHCPDCDFSRPVVRDDL